MMKYELTQTLADEICEHIGDGKSLRSFCEQEGRPSAPTVCRWLRMEETAWFAEQYARAREAQADAVFAEKLGRGHKLLHPVLAHRVAKLRVTKLCRTNALLLFLDSTAALQCQPQCPFHHFVRDRYLRIRRHELDQSADCFLDSGRVTSTQCAS